jgi:hypothetical protein
MVRAASGRCEGRDRSISLLEERGKVYISAPAAWLDAKAAQEWVISQLARQGWMRAA